MIIVSILTLINMFLSYLSIIFVEFSVPVVTLTDAYGLIIVHLCRMCMCSISIYCNESTFQAKLDGSFNICSLVILAFSK